MSIIPCNHNTWSFVMIPWLNLYLYDYSNEEQPLHICKSYCLEMLRKKAVINIPKNYYGNIISDFLKLIFTPCKAEKPLRGMELQEKEVQKD